MGASGAGLGRRDGLRPGPGRYQHRHCRRAGLPSDRTACAATRLPGPDRGQTGPMTATGNDVYKPLLRGIVGPPVEKGRLPREKAGSILGIDQNEAGMRKIAFAVALGLAGAASAQQDGALMRCGASTGQSYFFADETFTPDGPRWEDDRISEGKIVLINLGDEWDILFDDALGAHGYRSDGAIVVPISSTERYLMVAALHRNYVDVYTFDMDGSSVAWTSSKMGPFVPKSSVYYADCVKSIR